MSSINLGGLSQGFFQNLSATDDLPLTPAELAAADVANSAANTTATTGSIPAFQHHGGLFQKIEQSVLSALQSANSSNSTDANSIIQSAILKAISSANGGDSDADSDASSASATDSTSASGSTTSPESFFQVLQQYGVGQDQFAQDLKAAFQQSNGSQTNQDLTGLLVNTTG